MPVRIASFLHGPATVHEISPRVDCVATQAASAVRIAIDQLLFTFKKHVMIEFLWQFQMLPQLYSVACLLTLLEFDGVNGCKRPVALTLVGIFSS